MFFYIFGIIILMIIDIVIKNIIANNMSFGETVPIINNFFHITYVENRGIAFGIFQGKVDIITIITTIVVILIIIYFLKNINKFSFFEKIAYLFIISGALGNIFDRVFRGYVVDMLDFRGIWSFIFNIADVYINLGVIFLIIDLLQKRKKENLGGKK